MAVEKTFNGTTYNSVTSFAEVAYVPALLSMAGDIMEDAGRGLVTTSVTGATIGTGSKGPFTMASAIPYALGSFVTIADSAAPTTNYMVGQVTARSGTSLTVTVASGGAVGSGTKTAWDISISGPTGATGVATLAGSATGAIDMGGYSFTADLVKFQTGTEHLASAASQPSAVSGAQSLTLVAFCKHWLHINGDTTLTVSSGAAGDHLTDSVLQVDQDGATGGWALTISGATHARGETLDTTGMTAGQSVLLAFFEAPDGTILYNTATGYF